MTTQTKYKPSHIFIKPEDVKTYHKYAFNLAPEYQPTQGKLNSFKEWYDHFEHILRDICIASKYTMFVEISSKGRFHFHGYIEVHDIMNFYIFDVKTLMNNGTCVMKEIEDVTKWHEYIHKQEKFIQKYLKKELFSLLFQPMEYIRINTIHHP